MVIIAFLLEKNFVAKKSKKCLFHVKQKFYFDIGGGHVGFPFAYCGDG